MAVNWTDAWASTPDVLPLTVTKTARLSRAGSVSEPPCASFGEVLQAANEATKVRFSAHALSRLQERGVALSREDVLQLEAAVDTAGKKGARDAYLVFGDAGFVVNVPNRTVVTALTNGDGTLVTNIDSVVFVHRPDR